MLTLIAVAQAIAALAPTENCYESYTQQTQRQRGIHRIRLDGPANSSEPDLMGSSISMPAMGWNVLPDSRRSLPVAPNVVARIGAFLRPESRDYASERQPMSTLRQTWRPGMSDPRANHLLAALPEDDFARWQAHLEPCDMTLGKVLFEEGCQCTHAYVPTTSIISMLYLTEDGESVETAVAGCEGIVGLPLLMSGSLAPGRAMVRGAGQGYALKASWLMQEFDRSRPVQQLLLRYMQAFMTQTAQTAVCNRHHSLEQQLCRWLLMSLDRLPSDEIFATQELIASTLGVRREGVTAAARRLQDAGMIAYRRGHISVLDREGLEQSVCECYAVVKQHYEDLLPEALAA